MFKLIKDLSKAMFAGKSAAEEFKSPDPIEIEELKRKMGMISCIQEVADVFGDPDDRPRIVEDKYFDPSTRKLLNIHRYWRLWESISVDIGTWSDNGEIGYAYYPQPREGLCRTENKGAQVDN